MCVRGDERSVFYIFESCRTAKIRLLQFYIFSEKLFNRFDEKVTQLTYAQNFHRDRGGNISANMGIMNFYFIY